MAALIRIRRDTSNNWASNDPTLAQGELGLDTDTGVIKVGNGSDVWSDLLSIGAYNSTDRISKTFNMDTGSLIVDEFGKLYFDRGGTIIFDDTGNLFAGTGNSNFKISLDNHTGDVSEYNFGHDGNLTLPGGATIGDQYGDMNTELYAKAGQGVFVSNNSGDQYVGSHEDGVFIGTDYTNMGGYVWQFNKNGELLLPDGGVLSDWYNFTTLSNSVGAAIATTPGNAVVVNPTDGTWIYADNKEYIFGANGTVQLPGNIQLADTSVILAGPSHTGDDLYIEAIDFSEPNHTVIMVTSHGFADGDKIYINNIGPGSTQELDDTYCYAKVIDPDNFEIYSDKDLMMPIWDAGYTPFVYSGQQPLNGTVARIFDAGSINITASIPELNHDAGQINLNVSDKTWSLHADGNLVLPTDGYILNSDLSIYGGTGAGTADLAFVTGAMYRLGGVIVENADLSNAATGSLIIPGNGTGLDVQLNNSNGNVTVQTSAGTWTFGYDGNVILPVDGYILNSDLTVYGGSGSGLPEYNLAGNPGILTVNGAGVASWHQNDALSFNGFGMGMTGTNCNITFQHGSDLFAEFIVNDTVFNQKSVGEVKITSNRFAGPQDWTFGIDGRTILPTVTGPTHSYGAAGDKAGMVVLTADYIYYCKQDYVDNTTDIWVRSAWTGTNW